MRTIEAYGGEGRWRNATAVEATFSAWGWAFRLKWRRPFRRARGVFEVAEPRARITPIDGAGQLTGVLTGHDVHLEDAKGQVVKQRSNARSFFPGGRRLLFWDDLDQTYFAGYALWNYMTLPALLLRGDIEWREVSESTLEARFPPHLPTHCPVQQFHFAPDGLLRRHDYTAEVIGAGAHAAHVILEHGDSGGIPYSKRRRVTPRGRDGRPRRGPLLIAIEVHDFRLVSR